MNLYRFSPIKTEGDLYQAIHHLHHESYQLCFSSFGRFLPNSGNAGIFCHYPDEYSFLTDIRLRLTQPGDHPNQKYFTLHTPINIPATAEIPTAVYTHLYIRAPDPYRHHVGDIDFYLPSNEYTVLKKDLLNGKIIQNARIFPRADLDMIELYHPDIDVLAYVSTHQMTQTAHIKQPHGSS